MLLTVLDELRRKTYGGAPDCWGHKAAGSGTGAAPYSEEAVSTLNLIPRSWATVQRVEPLAAQRSAFAAHGAEPLRAKPTEVKQPRRSIRKQTEARDSQNHP